MDPIQVGVRLAAAALLVAGIRKFPEPEPTCRALKLVGLPSFRPWVWGLAVVEISVGLVALRAVTPVTAAIMGGLYLALTVFLAVARRRGVNCGCFGPGERPPGIVHLALNLAAVAICTLAVATL